ncbi:MAG: protein kinase [Chloroflexi bacterium]|nr:protein kinase [Chloroflexota bacterium]
MDNPYIFRGPVHDPEMFFGRTHELNEIAAFLRGNQSISIVGPRKIGKTSLLFHLMRPETWPDLGLGEDILFAYLDCEVLGEGEHAEILGQFAGEIETALDERDLPPEPALERAIDKPSRLSFEGAIRKLNRRGLRVVLVLDEFERLSTNASLNVNFFNALRSAAGRYKLAFLTGSARPLIQLTYSGKSQEILSSPFFNIFAPLFLGLLPEEEARQLIRGPAQTVGSPFPSATEDFIYNLVGGHPLALQVACFHAFEDPSDTAEIERRTTLELAPHFQYYWHNLTSDEQRTLRQLSSAAARASSDTTLRGVLRDLVQKCLLVSDNGAYLYPSRAWENFLSSSFVASSSPPAANLSGSDGLPSGTRLGTYEVLELLARGGMAEVYKGRHPRLDRTVAIKILSTSLAAEADFRQRFEREAQAVAALRHPNIVQVFDFGDVEGTYYMVMEFIDGVDLSGYVRETGQIPLEQVLPLLQDIANALDYAHAEGVIHRDVKPSNVMLQKERGGTRAILTDFGIAKIRASDTGVTKTGMMMGTLDYMAPEQVQGARKADGRADVYALAVMLYQMLTGALPFCGDNPGAVMLAHLQQPAPDPRLLVPELPENVAAAILRAMAKDPDARHSTAGELAEAIGV